MTSPTRVLVVEDDAAMAGGIVRGLLAAGFEVELATDGREGARKALDCPFDAVVLDLMLPLQSGIAVLEQLESRKSLPVLVLTARGELQDRVQCFELGAADFIVKPFWMEELVARIRTRLRVTPETKKRVVRFARAVLDLDGRLVTVHDVDVGLTRYEFDVLAHLVERAGRAISREQLADHALSPLEERDARTVDSHIARIRKKLGPEASTHIATVWGIGYRFEPEQGDT
jgi:two-component system, OmpR family, response regulator